MANETKAVVQLAQADLVQIRLIAQLIDILVLKKVIPPQGAAQMLEEASSFLPSDHPMLPEYRKLIAGYR